MGKNDITSGPGISGYHDSSYRVATALVKLLRQVRSANYALPLLKGEIFACSLTCGFIINKSLFSNEIFSYRQLLYPSN